ncbi:NAD(P)/FAD-dependent oxidoreductase [Sporobolomyces salmoneus]|uniref:NAD(P)/FAD-dependent oxidoreductase n=1 Tax=Sporobolomyces salmoneus TaxID=183962 RepID=UPI003174C5E9
MPAPRPPQLICIIGAGEFGSTTALSLAEGPYKGHESLITVVERGTELALDAASSDYNKIVRSEYSDPLYAKFARDAIIEWESNSRWKPHYHSSGVVALSAKSDPQTNYVQGAYEFNKRVLGEGMCECREDGGMKELYPRGVRTGSFSGDWGYKNRSGGWAASRDAVVATNSLARQLGVRYLVGEASHLLYNSNKTDVEGIKLSNGTSIRADFVISAMGAWTPLLVPELKDNCLPTGQTVAVIQLTKEEAEKYKEIPVSLCLDTGFYNFPPTSTGLVKFAIHDRGWLSPNPQLNLPSTPRTTLTPGYENQQIPASALEALKAGMERIHPELAEKEIIETRLCWYSDRESGDFLFDYHPRFPSLFIAAGGSGHAFKFMPLTGEWILSSIEKRLPEDLAKLWSFEGDASRLDKSRGEGPIVRKLLPNAKQAKL